MTTFLLIRHGQNDLLEKKLAGRLPDVHLNPKGREQAQRLSEVLSALPIKAVYASPLERAQETAEPIARSHGLLVETLPALLEINFGGWQGKKIKRLKKRRLWKAVQRKPSAVRFPDGESFTEAQDRIVEGLCSLSAHDKEKDLVVCVAHSDVIRLAVAYFLGLPLDNFQRIHIATASITVLHLDEGKASFGPINYTINFPAFPHK